MVTNCTSTLVGLGLWLGDARAPILLNPCRESSYNDEDYGDHSWLKLEQLGCSLDSSWTT